MIIYYAPFVNVSVAAAQDLFEIVAPSTSKITLLRLNITQNTSETSEQLSIIVKRVTGSPTSGSGGSTVTPVAAKTGITLAYGGTVEINNTTILTGGTQSVFFREGFNLLSGFEWRATPEDIIEVAASARIVVNLPTAPAASTPMNGLAVIGVG